MFLQTAIWIETLRKDSCYTTGMSGSASFGVADKSLLWTHTTTHTVEQFHRLDIAVLSVTTLKLSLSLPENCRAVGASTSAVLKPLPVLSPRLPWPTGN